MTAEFHPDARTAILEACLGRCAGCGRPHTPTHRLDIHHRRARATGGTSDPTLALPPNGVALCGPGNAAGCHGWAHTHPDHAVALGWIIPAGGADRPFRTPGGWRRWIVDTPDEPGHRYSEYLVEWVDLPVTLTLVEAAPPGVDPRVAAALRALTTARPTPTTPAGKPTR